MPTSDGDPFDPEGPMGKLEEAFLRPGSPDDVSGKAWESAIVDAARRIGWQLKKPVANSKKQYTQEELKALSDEEYCKLPWERKYTPMSRGGYDCRVREFIGLLVHVDKLKDADEKVNEEIIWLRSKRIQDGGTIPHPGDGYDKTYGQDRLA